MTPAARPSSAPRLIALRTWVKSSTSLSRTYGSAMSTAISTVVSHGGAFPMSAAARDARMRNATAPKKSVMSPCARVGRRTARHATLMKMRT